MVQSAGAQPSPILGDALACGRSTLRSDRQGEHLHRPVQLFVFFFGGDRSNMDDHGYLYAIYT